MWVTCKSINFIDTFPIKIYIRRNTKVQFSRWVITNSLQPHGLQYSRHPCPIPTPGACSNSCPLSQWCHPTISSSVIPFSSCLQSFLASGSFPMKRKNLSIGKDPVLFHQGLCISWPKYWEFQLQHQSFQWMNTHGMLGLTLLIFLQFKGLSKVFSNTAVQKHQFFGTQLSL